MALRVVAINAYRSALKRIAMNCTDKSNMVLKALISTDVREKIDKIVSSNKVVVFMKGDPEAPRCGFSNAVVQVFRMHGVEYDSHDVLSNETLRKAIKDYTCWPTIPQVFINGEFVGGCDILLEKHQNGELIEDLKKIGIKSALIDKENKEKDLSADEK